MRVEYGPPGHKGVTQIMGLGATGPVAGYVSLVPEDKSSRTVVGLAAATWLVGMFIGSSTVKNIAFGAVGAIAVVQLLKNRSDAPPAPPATVQGWG